MIFVNWDMLCYALLNLLVTIMKAFVGGNRIFDKE